MSDSRSISLLKWLPRQREILIAVILQDMKTRFGGSYLSYLLAIAWPLSHVATITLAYTFANSYAPVGDDPFIFVATAAIPYIICLYPTRFIAVAVLTGKPFLNYTVIAPYHLIVARTVLELMNASIVVVIILLICFVVDNHVLPLSASTAASALGASAFFGAALGFFFAVLMSVIGNYFGFFVIITMIVLYVGALAFVPEYLLGSEVRGYLAYNPIFCLIKWLRAAYYDSYQAEMESRYYVIFLSFLFLFLGLLGERMLRGRIVRS